MHNIRISRLELTSLHGRRPTTRPSPALEQEPPFAAGDGRDVVVPVGRRGAEALLLLAADAQPLDHGGHGDLLVAVALPGGEHLVDAAPERRRVLRPRRVGIFFLFFGEHVDLDG